MPSWHLQRSLSTQHPVSPTVLHTLALVKRGTATARLQGGCLCVSVLDSTTGMQASAFMGASLAVRQPCAPSTSARAAGQTPTTAVATPSRPPASNKAKRSKVELITEKSDFLRHPLMQVGPRWEMHAARRQCRRRRCLPGDHGLAACCCCSSCRHGIACPMLDRAPPGCPLSLSECAGAGDRGAFHQRGGGAAHEVPRLIHAGTRSAQPACLPACTALPCQVACRPLQRHMQGFNGCEAAAAGRHAGGAAARAARLF